MNLTAVAGFGAGIAAIVIGILLGGSLTDFVDASSVFIVVGGTIASTLISFPMSEIKKLPTLIKFALTNDNIDILKDIDEIIKLANLARKDGLLALENLTEDMKNPFMKNGIMLILDGTDPELIKNVQETDNYFMDERHSGGKKLLEAMASYAPAYGMIGTLIGLINMLVSLDDANKLGPAMAVALITTFYGVVLANLIFNPMANALGIRSKREQLQRDIIIEGILSIQDGENPRIIKDKLTAFLSKKEVNGSAPAPKNKNEEALDE